MKKLCCILLAVVLTVCLSACGGEKLFKLFATKIGREDMLSDERYSTAEARISNRAEINGIAADWVNQHTLEECQEIFGDDVPNGAVYSVKEIYEDPHIRFREDLVTVNTEKFGDITMQGIYPKLSETPGEVKWAGEALGKFNSEVYGEMLGFSEEELAALKEKGVI